MSRALVGLLFLLMLFSASAVLLLTGGFQPLREAALADSNRLERMERALSEHFPAEAQLRALRVSINYWGGSKEQNNVFIADDMLMLDVQSTDATIVNQNTNAVLSLSQQFGRPSYVMLIPTACAIQQRKVPYNSVAPLFNQQRLIDDVYRQMSGVLTAIDVYPTLFNHQNEYLYYRTDNSPTGLGGYYIYSAAAKKLGLSNPRGIEQFDVNHVDFNYYGDLYAVSPYRAVDPDRISTYIFSRYQRSYRVTHHDLSGERRYFTLYPEFKADLGNSKDIILGGVSPIVDIEIGNPQYSNKLLVLGDHTMQSYLPFLLIHYSWVTFIDTTSVTSQMLESVDFDDYNQVLFAYSVDGFLDTPQLLALEKMKTPSSVNE